ncbi:MAG: CRTAC1 family protein [Planctomycetes bacterium]|nr:CRTAC1 family protein [Planctomycetota bacterium]
MRRLLVIPFLLASCAGGDSPGGLFTEATAPAGIRFQLVSGASGKRFLPETMLGGLGWIDYDRDGDYDLYLANGHSDSYNADQPGKEEDRLYRNNGNGTFTDATAAAGLGDRRYSSGVAVGDYDNDGDSDLLVTNFGRNTLYRNNGDGTFADITEAAGLVETGFNASAVWFDMEDDGDLDLYIARYLRYHPHTSKHCREKENTVYCHPKFFPGEPDLLYRNLGNGKFEEIGRQAGIAKAGDQEGKGLGVVAFDFNRDGFQDIYVANDTTPNFLWKSSGTGSFTDMGYAMGVALSADGKAQAGMGIDLADVNGDGWTDLYVTNFAQETNALYLGSKEGSFTESCQRCNLGNTFIPLGFGTLFVDADLDGDPDIVTVNGHVNDLVELTDPGKGSTYKQRPNLFLNDGTGKFTERAEAGGAFFQERYVGRGLASSDYDNDGVSDLAVMTLDRSAILLRGSNPQHHNSLVIKLEGTKSNRDGYGARVEVEVQGRKQVFEVQSARSYLSACDPRLVVGLGRAPAADRVTVYWPSGKAQALAAVPASKRTLVIKED